MAFFLNLMFTLIEIAGGFLTNSLAILSDALHDLGDSLSLGLSWYFEKLAKRGRSSTFSYGYKRFSLLAAVINSLILMTGSIFILIYSLPRLLEPGTPDSLGMTYLAILGILVNGAAVVRLRKGKNLNQRAVLLHLLEDVLGWFAVLIGSLLISWTGWTVIDPILSIGIACFMLLNVYKTFKESITILLQGIPASITIEEIHKKIKHLPEISDIHDCHAWSLDGVHDVITLHLVLNENFTLESQAEIKSRVLDQLDLSPETHLTIEFESENEDCAYKDC